MLCSQTLSVISSRDWEKNHWSDKTSPAFWFWARFAGSIFILLNTARSWYYSIPCIWAFQDSFFPGVRLLTMGPLPQHSEPPYLTLLYAQIIFLLSLSPGETLTLFYPMHLSISGQFFSWRQAADNGPLASTFRTSILNPVICPDYILIISLSRRNVNPILPHAFEHFSTVFFLASGCWQWAPCLNIQNSYLILFYAQIIFLPALSLSSRWTNL